MVAQIREDAIKTFQEAYRYTFIIGSMCLIMVCYSNCFRFHMKLKTNLLMDKFESVFATG